MTGGRTKEVHLLELPVGAIDALARGDLSAANRAAPLLLTADFVEPEAARTWRMRSNQLELDPAVAPWITRVVVDVATGRAVGQAGFHGPPDEVGMVEVGYRIGAAHRRQGYGRAALVAMLALAAADARVHIVRATISPNNEPSRRLVSQYGFVEVGEQWDEEDGLETIFERPA